MTSLEIFEAKGAIKNFMAGKDFPATIKKMIYQELLIEAERAENAELQQEVAEREKKGEA